MSIEIRYKWVKARKLVIKRREQRLRERKYCISRRIQDTSGIGEYDMKRWFVDVKGSLYSLKTTRMDIDSSRGRGWFYILTGYRFYITTSV